MTIRLPRRRALALAAAPFALAAAPRSAAAQAPTQALPAGPIRLLIGFPAGGGTDVMGRLVAERIRERTGRTVVVENRAGASGTVAGDALKNAAPDGATIMLAPIAATAMAQLTFPKLTYDPRVDFAAITLLGTFQLAFAVAPGLGVSTPAEFAAWARANPKQASFGTTAMGSLPHFFGLEFGKAIGVDLQPVPYRGAAPLVTDLSGGQVPSGTGALTDFLEHHKAGRVRILATSGAKRALAGQDLPTFAESGFPGIVGEGWLGFFAPARTPRPIVDAFNREIAAIAAVPEMRERLIQLGLEPRTTTPDELAAFLAAEIVRWKPVVDASGFKAEQ